MADFRSGAPKDSDEPATASSEAAADRYYWEDESGADVSTTTAVAHNLHWWGSLALSGVDSVGGVLASFLGLTQSRYQFEVDYARRQREQIRRQILQRRQRELLEREARKRELQRRAGQPEDERSVEQAASEAYLAERARRRAAGVDEVEDAVRRGDVRRKDVPPALTHDDDDDDDDDDVPQTFTEAVDAMAEASTEQKAVSTQGRHGAAAPKSAESMV